MILYIIPLFLFILTGCAYKGLELIQSQKAITPHLISLTPKSISEHPLIVQLKQEESEVWQMLSEYQITPECVEKFAKQFPEYAKPRRHGLSEETIQLIFDIFHDFKIDKRTIALAQYNDPYCPAAVEHNTLFVDETLLKQYSKKAQRFIIAHEIQHIVHKDVILGTFAEQQLPRNGTNDYNHPMNRLRRFQERRADYMAITKAPCYAEGQIEFLEHYLKEFGAGNGVAHPKATTRLAYAKDILAAHNPMIV